MLNQLKNLLYLNKSGEPGWGLRKLSSALHTERATKLQRIMRDCTELEGLAYTPIIHKIIEKEIETAMEDKKDIPEEEGLLQSIKYMGAKGW